MIKGQAFVCWCPAFVGLSTLINEAVDVLCYELLVEETELKQK